MKCENSPNVLNRDPSDNATYSHTMAPMWIEDKRQKRAKKIEGIKTRC